jgi:hypothetical protein
MTELLATTSAATTCTTSMSDMHNQCEQPSITPWLLCSTCRVSLRSTQALQIHTNEPWQYVESTFSYKDINNNIVSAYNKKRRIASLAPIPQHVFDSKLKFQFESVEESSSAQASGDDELEPFVFWNHCENDEDESDEDETGEHDNDDTNDEEDIQSQRRVHVLSHTEMQLPSGKVVGSRYSEKKRHINRDDEKTKPATSLSPPSQDRTISLTASQARDVNAFLHAERAREQRVVRRDDMGLLGITAYQYRALLCAEKRAQKQEAMAMRSHEWSVNKWANVQKFDLAHDRSFSKAKGGNHKLLPR